MPTVAAFPAAPPGSTATQVGPFVPYVRVQHKPPRVRVKVRVRVRVIGTG